jgi:hypothetical protein
VFAFKPFVVIGLNKVHPDGCDTVFFEIAEGAAGFLLRCEVGCDDWHCRASGRVTKGTATAKGCRGTGAFAPAVDQRFGQVCSPTARPVTT